MINGNYASGELKNSCAVMLRRGNKHEWLIGKILYSFVVSVLHVTLLCVTLMIFSEKSYNGSSIYILGNLIITSIYITLFQTFIQILLTSALSFIFCFILLILSLYLNTPYLPGRHLMIDQIHEPFLISDLTFILCYGVILFILYIITTEYIKKKDYI